MADCLDRPGSPRLCPPFPLLPRENTDRTHPEPLVCSFDNQLWIFVAYRCLFVKEPFLSPTQVLPPGSLWTGPERGGVLLITTVLLDLPQPYMKSVPSEAVEEDDGQVSRSRNKGPSEQWITDQSKGLWPCLRSLSLTRARYLKVYSSRN